MKDNDSGSDNALREMLERQSLMTSEEHDSTVIRAAGEAGREIRQYRKAAASGRNQWLRPFAIAATLIVGFFLVFNSSRVPPPEPDSSIRGTAVAVVPVHQATIDELPTLFRWPAQAGATGYRVILRDANAVSVWRSDSAARNEIVIPDNVRDQLDVGATYLWTVDIEGVPGQRSLGPWWFRIDR